MTSVFTASHYPPRKESPDWFCQVSYSRCRLTFDRQDHEDQLLNNKVDSLNINILTNSNLSPKTIPHWIRHHRHFLPFNLSSKANSTISLLQWFVVHNASDQFCCLIVFCVSRFIQVLQFEWACIVATPRRKRHQRGLLIIYWREVCILLHISLCIVFCINAVNNIHFSDHAYIHQGIERKLPSAANNIV